MRAKKNFLNVVLVSLVCSVYTYAQAEETLVAEPERPTWAAPSFKGKPFWPLFAKRIHTHNETRPDSMRGLEDIPLTQAYATRLSTYDYRPNVTPYIKVRGNVKPDASGKRPYYTVAPKEGRLTSYTLRDLYEKTYGDFLYEGDWTTKRQWSPLKGNPFLLALEMSRPCFLLDGEDRGDKADFARWLAAHPDFIGFQAMGEMDSETENYKRAMNGGGNVHRVEGAVRKDLETRFPLPEDRYDFMRFMRLCWDTEVKFHFGVDKFWPLYCNNHALAHINAKLGAAGLVNEISSSQGSPWTWSGAYSRGASRQWGIPFSWYCATFYRGFKRNQAPGTPPVTGDNKWPRDGVHTKKRPAYCGASLSLSARQKYYGWLIGAAMIEDEPWTMLCSTMENGKHCPSPYAKVFNDVYVRSTKIERGSPLTPIALLTPLTETISRGGYVNVSMPNGKKGDYFHLPAYYFTLQPVHETNPSYPMLQERRRHGDEGCLFNSPFGEIWDVLTPDAGQETAKLSAALAHYPAAFLIGTYRQQDLDRAALETYVRTGGTLFVSCDYVNDGLLSSDFTGVSFGSEKVTSGVALLDETGARVERLNGAYALWQGVPRADVKPLLTDENGRVVAYTHTLGKGRVVTLCAIRGMPDFYHGHTISFNDTTYQQLRLKIISDNGELGLIRYLLDRVQRETIPVSIVGDIQWGVNQTSTGYLVWLINNKGVTKYYGEKQELDASKTARVVLKPRKPGSWRFRDADNGTDLTDGTLEVGPGDVRFVSISR